MPKRLALLLFVPLGAAALFGLLWRNDNLPFVWKTFRRATYRVSFQYPRNWDETCCPISGPVSPTAEHLVTIVDPRTLQANADAPFEGVAVYVDSNPTRESMSEYLNHEEDDLYALRMGLGWRTFPIDTRTALAPQTGVTANLVLGGRQGMLLKNFMDDDISRIYIPFPDDQRILILATPLGVHAEWDAMIENILATVRFE